jgi:hypothetical protein
MYSHTSMVARLNVALAAKRLAASAILEPDGDR